MVGSIDPPRRSLALGGRPMSIPDRHVVFAAPTAVARVVRACVVGTRQSGTTGAFRAGRPY